MPPASNPADRLVFARSPAGDPVAECELAAGERELLPALAREAAAALLAATPAQRRYLVPGRNPKQPLTRQACFLLLKQIALDVAAATRMVEAVKTAGVVAAIGFMYRFGDAVRQGGHPVETIGDAIVLAFRDPRQVATVQNLYNLTNRQSEDVLDYCERQGIGFIPWFPLAAGQLSEPGGAVADTGNKASSTAKTTMRMMPETNSGTVRADCPTTLIVLSRRLP